MFRCTESIEKVEYYSVKNSKLIYKNQDDSSIHLKDEGTVLDEYKYYGYLNEKIIQYQKQGKHYIIFIEAQETYEVPAVFSCLSNDNKFAYYTDNYNYDKTIKRSRRDLYSFDLSDKTRKKILSNTAEILIFANESSLLLFLPKTTLRSLSLLTGEYEWEAELNGRTYTHLGETKEATIQAIIGFWENYLLVSMTHFELVALDINTGKIIWETNDLDRRLKSVFPPHMHYAYTRNMFIEDGFVYEMASSLYYRVDIKTQALEILWKDKREDFITVKYTHQTPEMIYFVASHKNQLQCSILGVFNRKTLEIDWQEDINVQIDPALGYYASINRAPQATEDKIYVLDTAGTLYIYEKMEVEE